MSWIKNNEWLVPRHDRSVNWRSLARFAGNYGPFWKGLIGAGGLSLIGSLTILMIPVIFSTLQRAISTRNARLVWMAVAGYLAMLLLQTGITHVIRIVRTQISSQLNEKLLLDYYRKLLNISIEDFLEFRQKTNLFQRLIDAMTVTAQCMEVAIQGMQAGILTLMLLLVIALINPIIACIVVTGVAALFLFSYRQSHRLQEQRQKLLAVNYPLVNKMIEVIENIFTIKALTASIQITSDVQRLTTQKKKAECGEAIAEAASTQGTQTISALILAVTIGAIAAQLLYHRLEYSQAITLYVLVGSSLAPIVELARLYQSVSSLSVNIQNYYQVLDIPDEGNHAAEEEQRVPLSTGIFAGIMRESSQVRITAAGSGAWGRLPAAPSAAAATLHYESSCGHIVFEDVDFAYRGGPRVLTGLNLEIFPGEKISLIGRSGAGKSTLFRLLLTFIQPQRGHIYVDGIDINGWPDKTCYRRQFGVVAQHDMFFETNLRENLLFGLASARPDEEIEYALRLVNMWDSISQLHRGLDSTYSKDMFSGGQKQRLLIARALLRSPKIVLLDEPTSALDFENEAKIITALSELAGNRTTLTIAHRLSTIRSSDRVIVLDDGKIVASGLHEELYNTNDYYSALCRYNSFML
jgi:ABC-type bacteriocin/lantibiotic exporter with double-glycine peptidase domain